MDRLSLSDHFVHSAGLFHRRRPLVERRGPRRFKSQALKFPGAVTVYRPAFVGSTPKFADLSTNFQQPRPNRRRFTVGRQVDYRLNRLMNCARVSRFRIRERPTIRRVIEKFWQAIRRVVQIVAVGIDEIFDGVIRDARIDLPLQFV